jgi:glycosyltransferase involved in cell wall biosynthesis
LSRRLKIAYLGIKSLPALRGADRVVEGIVQKLNSRHVLTVYCCSSLTASDVKYPKIDIKRIPTIPGKHLAPIIYFINCAIHALFHKYDGIHIHNAEAGFVIPLLRIRFPVVATAHGPAYAREKWGKLSRQLIRAVDYFFMYFPSRRTSVSLPYAKAYEARYHRKVEYIPNGMDQNPEVDTKKSVVLLKEIGISNPFILFSAGRLDPTKGCHLLIDAFSELKWNGSLLVVGDEKTHPEYSKSLRKVADERTFFLSLIKSRSLLYGIIRKAKLFVFPSTVEAMSMMLLEVAGLGVPVVCSDIPENRLVMGESAVYFSSGDSKSLRLVLDWALKHPFQMKTMAGRAERMVRAAYDWNTISEQYDKIYIKTFGH